MLLPESQTRAVLIHGTARGSCPQSNKQSCVHMQVPVKCMKFNQEPVLGCLATDSVSAEFSLDVSPFANKSSRDAWTFAGVRACEECLCTISWASFCNQASRASAQTCIASLVILTPGWLSCRTLCKYESQLGLLLPGTFLRLLPDSLALGTAVAGVASAIRSQQEQLCTGLLVVDSTSRRHFNFAAYRTVISSL